MSELEETSGGGDNVFDRRMVTPRVMDSRRSAEGMVPMVVGMAPEVGGAVAFEFAFVGFPFAPVELPPAFSLLPTVAEECVDLARIALSILQRTL